MIIGEEARRGGGEEESGEGREGREEERIY